MNRSSINASTQENAVFGSECEQVWPVSILFLIFLLAFPLIHFCFFVAMVTTNTHATGALSLLVISFILLVVLSFDYFSKPAPFPLSILCFEIVIDLFGAIGITLYKIFACALLNYLLAVKLIANLVFFLDLGNINPYDSQSWQIVIYSTYLIVNLVNIVVILLYRRVLNEIFVDPQILATQILPVPSVSGVSDRIRKQLQTGRFREISIGMSRQVELQESPNQAPRQPYEAKSSNADNLTKYLAMEMQERHEEEVCETKDNIENENEEDSNTVIVHDTGDEMDRNTINVSNLNASNDTDKQDTLGTIEDLDEQVVHDMTRVRVCVSLCVSVFVYLCCCLCWMMMKECRRKIVFVLEALAMCGFLCFVLNCFVLLCFLHVSIGVVADDMKKIVCFCLVCCPLDVLMV